MPELVKYEAARRALAEALKIDEAKDIADKSEALRLYARQTKNSDMEVWAAHIRVRAERRIGELSKALEKGTKKLNGRNPDGTPRFELPTAGKSEKKAALKAAGLSTSKANRCEKLAKIPENDFESFIEDKRSRNKPVSSAQVISAVTAKQREKEAKEELQANPPTIPKGLFFGDFRDYAKSIPDDSIELIFTDPPYDRESISLFEDMAEIAGRVLRPGGSLIAYCGHIQLPEVLARMSKHLRYWWVNACIHSGTPSRMNKYGIQVTWKPMVWFVKGKRGDVQSMLQDSISGGLEKEHHCWQQAQSEAEYYIEKLCSSNGLVWEPFGGGGTTIAACKSLGRNWIACEIDESAVLQIAKRVNS